MGYHKKRIEPLITEKKKFDQIGHAVLELSSIEKLPTCVFGRRRSPFSKIFPTELGPELFFGESRDNLLTPGEEMVHPPKSVRSSHILAKMLHVLIGPWARCGAASFVGEIKALGTWRSSFPSVLPNSPVSFRFHKNLPQIASCTTNH